MNLIGEILLKTKINVSHESYTLVSIQENDFHKLLENPNLSPRMTAPFMIFKDQFEITLLLDEIDFGKIRNEIPNAKIESGFRLLTFDIVLDFKTVGFLAEITKILAEADVSIIALSAFSRDHILVKQENLAKALKALGEYVGELC
jgi:hypothetical protein